MDVLFPLLAAEDADTAQHHAGVLARLLDDALLERFAPPPPGTDPWQGAPAWQLPALHGLHRLARHVAAAFLAKSQDSSALGRVCTALGSEPDLVAALGAAASAGSIRGLDQFSGAFGGYESPGQISLSPSYRCSGSCPYCYSQGLSGQFPHDLPVDSLAGLVAWMKRSGIGLLLLAGGEPTEYPHLETLLDLLTRQRMRVYMATHNLFDGDRLRLFERRLAHRGTQVIERVSVHLWPRRAYSPALWSRFQRNLDMWSTQEVGLSVRFNLLDPGDYPDGLLDVCRQFDVRHVSLGLAFPPPNGVGVRKEEFGLFAPLLVDLAQEAIHGDLSLRLAKPVPWCAFSPEEARLLKRARVLSAVCTACRHRGTQNIMVNPDLSTFACQALPTRGPSLLSCRTVADLADEYEPQVSAALLRPLYDRCGDCYYYRQRACQGACLAYKIGPVQGDTRGIHSE